METLCVRKREKADNYKKTKKAFNGYPRNWILNHPPTLKKNLYSKIGT